MVDLGSAVADLFPRHVDVVGSKSYHRHFATLLPFGIWDSPRVLVGTKSTTRTLFECNVLRGPLGSGTNGTVARIQFTRSCFCLAFVVVFCESLRGKNLVAGYQANDLLPDCGNIDSVSDI